MTKLNFLSFTFTLSLIIIFPKNIFAAGWFCKEAASEKVGQEITACGIGIEKTEDKARKLALKNAFAEMDMICDKSDDCKFFKLKIEPMRSDCQKIKKENKYKCYRAVKALISKTKRREKYVKGSTLQKEIPKIELTVKIDPDKLKGDKSVKVDDNSRGLVLNQIREVNKRQLEIIEKIGRKSDGAIKGLESMCQCRENWFEQLYQDKNIDRDRNCKPGCCCCSPDSEVVEKYLDVFPKL